MGREPTYPLEKTTAPPDRSDAGSPATATTGRCPVGTLSAAIGG